MEKAKTREDFSCSIDITKEEDASDQPEVNKINKDQVTPHESPHINTDENQEQEDVGFKGFGFSEALLNTLEL